MYRMATGLAGLTAADGDAITGTFNVEGFDLSQGSTLKTAEAINIGTLVGFFTATGCHVPATECSGG